MPNKKKILTLVLKRESNGPRGLRLRSTIGPS